MNTGNTPADTLLFSLGVAVSSLVIFCVGATVMAVVARTRVRHPFLRLYLGLLGVMFLHWIASTAIHVAGNLEFHPETISELLQLPGSRPWIAVLSLLDRLLLAAEMYLILFCGRVATRRLGGRHGRRVLFLSGLAILGFVVGERLVNLSFSSAEPSRAFLDLRALWYSLGNLLTLLTTGIAATRMIRGSKRVLFEYIGTSYKSLGWLLVSYLALILGLAIVGVLPGNLLGSVSQSLWYLLTVSALFTMLGLWNLIVGMRILTTSLPKKNSQTLHQSETLSRYGLTQRETQIVWLLAQGLVNKEVAGQLELSESTVKNHIYNVYKKLNISSRAGLVKVLRAATDS